MNVNDMRKMQKMKRNQNQHDRDDERCTVDIGDDSEKQYEFVKVIRWLSDNVKNPFKVIIQARELSGRQRQFTLMKEKNNIETTIKHILGEIDITIQESDYNPNAID